MQHRFYKGLLCWGSSKSANPWNDQAWHNRLAAALESGLDDSPMYDNLNFDSVNHVLPLHDVGLNSLYINDCQLLARMAKVLGKKAEEKELLQRAGLLNKELKTCWSAEKNIFLNRHADTRRFSEVITPTLLYPMLSGTATKTQAQAMVQQVLLNPNLLGGEHIIPSLSRDHPDFAKQRYWKGSIWPPLNFLVYLSLRQADQKQAKQLLANKSVELLLREYNTKGFVSENYSSITGTGDNPGIKSEHYYFWGGLLGLIGLMEAGYY
jgi:neutral trehalase